MPRFRHVPEGTRRPLLLCGALALMTVALPPGSHPARAASGSCDSSMTLEAGDTLGRLASQCNTTVGAIQAANPGLGDPRRLRIGQQVTMPGAADTDANTGTDTGSQAPTTPAARAPAPGSEPASPSREQRDMITVRGEIIEGGVECPALRGDDGRLYALAGAERDAVSPGDRVEVEGSLTDTSFCMQGITLGVKRLTELGPDESRDSGTGDAGAVPQPGDTLDVRRVTGIITDDGVECPALRTDAGETFTLTGDLEGFGPGDRVYVEGQKAEMSTCMQGTTLNVLLIEPRS